MKEVIIRRLKDLEKEKNIRILFAVESGSREWGFASEDSDYDIRCVHVSPRDSYLSLTHPPEQISLIEGDLDIVSWDIRKFFTLFLKSNPTVSEWLSSKVSYIEGRFAGADRDNLRQIFDRGFSRSTLMKHYVSLARKNYSKYIGKDDEPVLLKKYVYILRALGCAEFIKQTGNLPPLNWKESSIYLPEDIRSEFAKLVKLKQTSESTCDSRVKRVDEFIEEKFREEVSQAHDSFDKKYLNDLVVKVINLDQ